MNILLTGARAPYTLDLGRNLSALGHNIYYADSYFLALSRFSHTCQAFIKLPSPRYKTKDFVQTLSKYLIKYHIEWLIPTCEEIFYIAQHKLEFPKDVNIFCDDFDNLNLLHNKYSFIQTIQSFRHENIKIPTTILLNNSSDREDLMSKDNHWIFKPVYSRFGENVYDNYQPEHKGSPPITDTDPWIAQEYVKGEEYCSYTIAHKGKVKAHTVYKSQYQAGGASTFFEHYPSKILENWIENIIASINFHGQIAFDFIKTEEGNYYPIECNPRMTSGLHNLCPSPQIDKVFTDEATQKIAPLVGANKIGLAMTVFNKNKDRQYKEDFRRSRDVISCATDHSPQWGQYLSYSGFLLKALFKNISPIEASVEDIAFNPLTIIKSNH